MIRLLFPPICLHCREESHTLFCPGCAAYFELIDPLTRCPFCFSENEHRMPCAKCIQKKRWQMKIAASLDGFSPVHTIVRKLAGGGMPYLAKTAASFMFMQYERLGWELPDLLIPIPKRLWFQGSNHVTSIAHALSVYTKVPLCIALGRQIEVTDFYLKKRVSIEGKVVLLIDDVLRTGHTLRCAAEALKDGLPKKIYALTFASRDI